MHGGTKIVQVGGAVVREIVYQMRMAAYKPIPEIKNGVGLVGQYGTGEAQVADIVVGEQ